MASDLDTDTAQAHAMFRSFDGMEGVPEIVLAPPRKRGFAGTVRVVYPGVLVALTIALAATWLSQHYGAPVMLFGLLLGMAFHFLHEEGRCVAGIEFSSKAILRLGVALLGVRVTAEQIMSLGPTPILLVVVGVVSTIGLGLAVAPHLGRTKAFGVLSGGAVAICGASAALAIASVLPKAKDSERDTILTVVTVTAMSTVAMIIYPLIAVRLGLSDIQAGVFLGGTIHDVAQVVGAGYSISPETGDVATYVKLLRVAMLAPVVFAISVVAARSAGGAGGAGGGRIPTPPIFLLGFAALVAINSLGFLPKPVVAGVTSLSSWCLVTAIAALGMKTSFKDVAAVGWRPIAMMVGETLWIGGFVLTAVLLTR
ncbi:MAG TPA: putative sulfate exporter family transporter [Phenylobacterium sp.]|nr:putative sulfate exporter family transporter [Phenylobacterium sp.]